MAKYAKRSRSRRAGRSIRRYRYKRRRMARRSRGTWSTAKGLAFPTRWKRTLNYVEKIILNPADAGLSAFHVFIANGCHDPSVTGVGHQPLGFDEIMQGYNRFTVIGAKITATFNANTATAGTQPVICGIDVSDTTAGIADVTTIMEQGRAKYKTMAAQGMGGPAVVNVTQAVSVKKFLGITQVLGEDNLQGTQSSDPIRQIYFKVFAADTGTDDPGAVECVVKIEYHVVFHQPRRLVQS